MKDAVSVFPPSQKANPSFVNAESVGSAAPRSKKPGVTKSPYKGAVSQKLSAEKQRPVLKAEIRQLEPIHLEGPKRPQTG